MPTFFFIVACSFAAANGQEPIQPALPVNEESIAKIKQLKPNQAAIIGEAKVIGEFNEVAKKHELDRTGPRGRDVTIKVIWAPERNRALFCRANHGTPHRLKDVGEFDLASMAWIMLYAPENPRVYAGIGKDFSDVEFKDGILITKRSSSSTWTAKHRVSNTRYNAVAGDGDRATYRTKSCCRAWATHRMG